MSLVKKVKEFFSNISLPRWVETAIEKAALRDIDARRQQIAQFMREDGRILMRTREILREKGFEAAACGVDRFDAYFIRTGKVHPILVQGELELRKETKQVAS